MSRPDIPVTISGDDRSFRAAMARVRAAAGTTSNNVVAAIMRIKSAGGALPAFFAAAGITAMVASAREAASAVASIGDEAKRAGLSAKSFQELKFVAEQNRIGVDQLTDGIKELNLRADEFISTGGGAAAEAFQRLGYNADELKIKLKDPSALFTEIIGKLGGLEKAAQIRVADEIFGGSAGERFVELIDQGEAGIRDTIKAANDLGLVFDDEMIEKAKEVDRLFNIVATTVGTHLKGAIVEAAGALLSFIRGFNAFEARQDATLEENLASLSERRVAAEERVNELRKKRASGDLGAGDGVFGTSIGESTVGEAIADRERELEAVQAEQDIIQNILDTRRKQREEMENIKVGGGTVTNTNKNSADVSKSSGGGSRRSTATETDKEAEAVKRVVEALQNEISVIGLSAVEREKLQALREAGVTTASKEGQEISALVEQKHRELAAEEALVEARERAQEAAEDFGATLDDQLDRVIDGTFEARDALAALAKELANAMTGGKGLFSGLFSQIFGGGNLLSSSFVPNTTLGGVLGYGGPRAGGGGVSPGRLYQVNEKEQEFFVPRQHGDIVAPSRSANQSRESRRVDIHVDVTGARGDKDILDMVSRGVTAGIREYDLDAGPSMVQRVINDPRARG